MERKSVKSVPQQLELFSLDQAEIENLNRQQQIMLESPSSVYSFGSVAASTRTRKTSVRTTQHVPHRKTSQSSINQFQRTNSQQDLPDGWNQTSAGGNKHKQSLPINLQPYMNEVLGIAEDQMQRTPSIRKISLVRQPSSMVDDASPGRGLFRKRRQTQEETALIFTLGDIKSSDDGGNDEGVSTSAPIPQGPPDIFVSPSFGDVEDQQDGKEESGDSVGSSGATAVISTPPKSLHHSSASAPAEMNQPHTTTAGIEHRFLGLTPNLSANNLLSSAASSRSVRSSFSLTKQSEESLEREEEVKIAKKQRFWDYFTMVASLIYAIGFSLFGLVFYLSDVFITRAAHFSAANFFNIYLCIVGIAWLLWLIYDINNYTKMMQKFAHTHSNFNFKLVKGEDGELMISIPITSEDDKLPEYYCFSNGRHSGSFFLKIGAAAFCLGHLVFIGLNLGKQIVFFVYDGDSCQNVENLIFTSLMPIYIFLQLFIIFKYSNVIVNRSKALARFAFMHCIMSSLCFWIAAILKETMDSIVDKKFFYEKHYCVDDHGSFRAEAKNVTCFTPEYNETYCTRLEEFTFETDINCLLARMCVCAENNEIAKYIFNLGPYLYPFSIEFSILVVAIWYIMWSNIGKVEENKMHMDFLPTPRQSVDLTEKPVNEAMIVYADCHSSMKGLFLGLVFVALAIIGMIVFFILSASDSCSSQDTAVTVNDVFESSLLGIMIVVSAWVYYKISGLEINPHPISFLDDLLLFICIPSYFLYFSFRVLPGLDFNDTELVGNFVTNVLMLAQVVLQTPMIVDGLRRCSDSAENQDKKPGRNLVTFLLVSNLAIYFWETMEVKNVSYQGVWKDFYGTNLWTLMSHMLLPLCIFYRFHSAVALADIWSSAYKPGDHH